MKLELDSTAVQGRYEEAVERYFLYASWLTIEYGQDFLGFLDMKSGHLDKLRRLWANLEGAEEILGLERGYIERLYAEAKEKSDRTMKLGML